MKIYKFKDLTDPKKHSHFYQIVLENIIWCAKADSLNDEDEFKFKYDYKPSLRTYSLLSQLVAKYKTTDIPSHTSASLALKNGRLEVHMEPFIKRIIYDCRNTYGIVSFSLTNTDHLWTKYGGNGNGACIEIEIQDELIYKSYYPVEYVAEKIFHIDSFLESDLFSDKVFNTVRNIMLTKHNKWSKEKEIRFIAKRQEVNMEIMDSRINEITFGSHVPAEIFCQMKAKIDAHCNANAINITKL